MPMRKKHLISEKYIPWILLGAVLFAQLFGILCLFNLKSNMDQFTLRVYGSQELAHHSMIAMDDIATDVYEYEAMLARLIMAESDVELAAYENRMIERRQDVEDALEDALDILSKNEAIKNSEEFEILRRSVKAYLNAGDLAIEIRSTMDRDLAIFLLNNEMNSYVETVNSCIESIHDMTEEEVEKTALSMNASVDWINLTYTLGIGIQILMTLICLGFCYIMMKMQTRYMNEAYEATKSKSEFMSNMSHELRTPLNAIIGMNEMIARETTSELIRDYTGKIYSAGYGLLSMVNDILDYSKIEAGKMELCEDTYRTEDLFSDIWNMISIRARNKSIFLKFDIDPYLPTELRGDDVRLKQIIVNMLTNAVKYTDEGSVTMTVKSERIEVDRIRLTVAITDTGIGLKAEDIEGLSNPFERVDEKKNRRIEGTGLGLSIVTNLLKLMDSKLEIASVYGEGSTFSFSVIQEVIDFGFIGHFDPNERRTSVRTKNKPLFTAPEAKVLVADDNEINRVVLENLLGRTEVKIDVAIGGEEALAFAERFHYDLMLLDHRMPDIDGIEVLKRVKASGHNMGTPVLVVSADVLSGKGDYYKSLGFDDYVAKPIDSRDLEDKMLRHLPEGLIVREE